MKRYESGPGRSIVLARLKGTGSAQADPAPAPHGRRAHRSQPMEARSVRRRDRRRQHLGTRDDGHEGAGGRPAHGVPVAEAAERAARPRRDPDGRARRGDRRRARAPTGCARTTTRELRSRSTSSTRAGFGSRDLFAPGKLVFGISVAEKKIMWLKLRAEGDRRPRLAAARSEPQRSADARARAAARRAAADRAVRRARHDEGARRAAGGQQVQQRDSALDDLDHQPAVGGRRSAEGQRHPVGGGSDARLPRAARGRRRTSGSRRSRGASAIPRSRSRSSTKGRIRS